MVCMQRIKTTTRYNWQKSVEEIGFGYHSTDVPYWDESAYYKFSLAEIEQLEAATSQLWEMCLQAVQHIINNQLYELFKVQPDFIQCLEESWNEDAPSIYGRFDLCYKNGVIKLLEFNADTPTGLYEAGTVQWFWLQDFDKHKDQFNSIHEKLIAYWKYLRSYLHEGPVHFSCLKETLEDLSNTEYMRDCAMQAGLDTKLIYLDDIGWDATAQQFVDLEEESIKNIFKLYPWEWLVKDEFGLNILKDSHKSFWIEPAWKMLLSNKAILPVLWELFPGNEFLLPSFFVDNGMKDYVKKPILGREGANIDIVEYYGTTFKTEGTYGQEGYVYQALCKLPEFEGNFPLIGSWVIGQEPAGIGIRESNGPITNNLSRFVPHLIEG